MTAEEKLAHQRLSVLQLAEILGYIVILSNIAIIQLIKSLYLSNHYPANSPGAIMPPEVTK